MMTLGSTNLERSISRRELFGTAAGLAATGVIPGAALAIEPPKRAGASYMRVSCAAYSYRDHLTGKKQPAMTLDDFVNRMAEVGIDGVELTSYYFPDPVTADYLHRLSRRCYQLGLAVQGTAIGNKFTVPAGDERGKEIAKVRQGVDWAVDLGAPAVRIFAGGAPDGVTDDQAIKWVIESIEEAAEYAGQKGVMLVMENHGGVTATADGVLAILRGVKNDWFGYKFDSGNFRTADPYADLMKVAPYAVSTHLKTDIYREKQREDADLARIVKILRDAGYRGYLHLEYEAAGDPLTEVPRILGELKRLAG